MTQPGTRRSTVSRFVLPALAVSMAWWGYPSVVQAGSFMGLGDLPGGSTQSRAFAVSANGLVVVGASVSGSGQPEVPRQEAFRWTAEDGMMPLGDLEGGDFFSAALDVSADGSVVVGTSRSTSGREAFRWESGVMTGLSDFAGGDFESEAQGVSADGLVVVGRGVSAAGSEAFRWRDGSGLLPLGNLPAGSTESSARAITPDGSIVAGWSTSATGTEAFLLEDNNVVTPLDDLSGGIVSSSPTAITPDGSVVVGRGITTAGSEAARWESGMVIALGDLPGGSLESLATAVSADGSIVVGLGNIVLLSMETDSDAEPFIWDETNGMRSLQSFLTTAGLDLTGWQLFEAWGISDDGTVIVGSGINPDGNTEAWRAVIPEPGTAAVVLTLGTLFSTTRRRSA